MKYTWSLNVSENPMIQITVTLHLTGAKEEAY